MALIEEGFQSPYGPAHVNDYITSAPGEPTAPEELAALQAADRETNRLNDEALRRALAAADMD